MDAVGLANAMIAYYAEQYTGTWLRNTPQSAGASDMLTHAVSVALNISTEDAIEYVGDRITDILCNRD